MIDAGDELGVCAINVAEFYSGLPAERRDVWRNFLMALPYWEIAHETAENAGVQRYSLARAGRNVSTTDALVASVARQHNATINYGKREGLSPRRHQGHLTPEPTISTAAGATQWRLPATPGRPVAEMQ